MKNNEKVPFSLTEEQAAAFEPSNEPVSLSMTCSMINSLIDTYSMQKLMRSDVSEWLNTQGFLEVIETDGKQRLVVTEKGRMIGITYETRMSDSGPYKANFYNKEAQLFILKNIDEIIKYKN